jgi:signal transduction histidine kinase
LDTKLKKYSHLLVTKVIVFILVVLCFTGAIRAIVELEVIHDSNFNTVFEDDYFHSQAYIGESDQIIADLTRLISEFKNEEYILSGGTISEQEVRNEASDLFSEFQFQSSSYNPELGEEANYEKFKEVYADKLTKVREKLIKADLREFTRTLQNIEEYEDPLYFASDGVNTYTNLSMIESDQFQNYPSYMRFEEYKSEIFPKKVQENDRLFWITETLDEMDMENTVIYVAFTDDFLNRKVNEWKEVKGIATKSFYQLLGFLGGFILSFVYLVLVIGRKSFKDQELQFHAGDKLYNDIKLVLIGGLVFLWVALVDVLFENIDKVIIPITIPLAILALILILSLVKHIKNRTFFKHTLIYQILYKLVSFVGEVYKSGSVGVKTVLLVIGYPILVAATFFIFPITLGLAGWFALKKIKSFKAIQEGVAEIKAGNLRHRIETTGKGEFGRLAGNINSITDGLKTAVNSELKSERLKTELITNVSHDIRTPLTSIITYVDLLKNETDPSKVAGYLDILDQKSQRLKILTEDLFEAAKASSGTIPVQLEQIDLVSLVTQGLGEVNDKIEAVNLDVKLSFPNEKVVITADGKLLWRSIENLLSNIFKYALRESRVYIGIEDLGNEVLLTFKNISAYELNITADELMERFKRGDESRSSQGSGLGLSIAKSLIEIQKGKFEIQIDGDLFKAMIYLPK